MRELREIAETFQVSRPIFTITCGSVAATRLIVDESKPIHKYRPTHAGSNSLMTLMCIEYRETFSIKDQTFTIEREAIAIKAMSSIRNRMAVFLERNLKTKNPRQTFLYKWVYRSMPNDDHFNDALVMLYKYMCSFTTVDMRADNINQKHIDNTIAILTAMKEKYE